MTMALLAGPAASEVEVHYRNGRVDLRAASAPLSEVLDRLGRATAMKIVQEGQTPSVQLNLTLEGRTPAEAVFGVLEGLGLNYAFSFDRTGDRIETLILAGLSGSKTAPATFRPASPPNRFVPRVGQPMADDSEAVEDVPLTDDEEDGAVNEGEGEEPAEEGVVDPAAAGAPAPPRGSVLQAPAEPLFPNSPFAPRAPMFAPAPEPPPPVDQVPKPPEKK